VNDFVGDTVDANGGQMREKEPSPLALPPVAQQPVQHQQFTSFSNEAFESNEPYSATLPPQEAPFRPGGGGWIPPLATRQASLADTEYSRPPNVTQPSKLHMNNQPPLIRPMPGKGNQKGIVQPFGDRSHWHRAKRV